MKYFQFKIVFDMGSKTTCANDYVEILAPNENREFVSQKRYCGDDSPAPFVSPSHQVKIRYIQTVNFAGTGWTLNFIGINEGGFVLFTYMLLISYFSRFHSSKLVIDHSSY